MFDERLGALLVGGFGADDFVGLKLANGVVETVAAQHDYVVDGAQGCGKLGAGSRSEERMRRVEDCRHHDASAGQAFGAADVSGREDIEMSGNQLPFLSGASQACRDAHGAGKLDNFFSCIQAL